MKRFAFALPVLALLVFTSCGPKIQTPAAPSQPTSSSSSQEDSQGEFPEYSEAEKKLAEDFAKNIFGTNLDIGGQVPSTFPSDIPIYAGSRYQGALKDPAGGPSGIYTFLAQGSLADITTFYERAFVAAGFRLENPAGGFDLPPEVAEEGWVRFFRKGVLQGTISIGKDEATDLWAIGYLL